MREKKSWNMLKYEKNEHYIIITQVQLCIGLLIILSMLLTCIYISWRVYGSDIRVYHANQKAVSRDFPIQANVQLTPQTNDLARRISRRDSEAEQHRDQHATEHTPSTVHVKRE
eukprot:TRINITY_DN34063_c0_g1_i1.p1 TRINITY_DN34063_c0_g1~~TRINITY_DN34063_c0_g1_i1.p1  ORF type:complete len:114 (+),score=11.63 TRINITY_DN34063_c0_g1_i1:113-454(+)